MVDAKTFERAIIYAAEAHKGQFRKGDGRPYILHPISVMNRILSVKKSTNPYLLGTAAILHDVVEDCFKELSDREKLDEISNRFGYAVASLVEELTLDKRMYEWLGKREYLARELVNMTSYALAIKLCDRLDNVCDMEKMGEIFRTNYTAETYFILNKLNNRKHLSKTHKKLIELIEKECLKYFSFPQDYKSPK